MKKFFGKKMICLLCVFALMLGITGCGIGGEENQDGKTEVILNEVAHSMVCADKGSIERY